MAQHRILFAGTPDIAVPLLRELSASFEVAGVLTPSDKSVGRSSTPVPCPVKAAALELGLPVIQFDSIRTEARNAVSALGADTLVTFAFGRIFGPRFLALFPNGRFNVHPSALPLLRGPSPVQYTIAEGLENATISLQDMGVGMDEGDIWGTCTIPLDGTENDLTLSQRIADEASVFVPGLLRRVFEGAVQPVPQSGEATYCTMIDRDFGRLDFSKTAREVHCRIRACYPWPKAWATVNGSSIAITGVWGNYEELELSEFSEGRECGAVVGMRKDRGIGVACSDRILWITALQLPAKKELDFKAFVNGNRWILDSRFE